MNSIYNTSTNYLFAAESSIIEAACLLGEAPCSVSEALSSVSEAVPSQFTFSNVDQGCTRGYIKREPTAIVRKI